MTFFYFFALNPLCAKFTLKVQVLYFDYPLACSKLSIVLGKIKFYAMIKIEEEKLIIEIKHPCPEEFRKDLKEALIGTMQFQTQDFNNLKELHSINFTLLELLKNLE